MREPSSIPSFLGRGVPEYPAMFCLPELQDFPPSETDHSPNCNRYQGCKQSQAPPGSLRSVTGAEVDRRGRGSIMRQCSSEVGKVSQRKHCEVGGWSCGQYNDQER